MRYLVLLLLLVPSLSFAEPSMDCEAVSGAKCRDACLAGEISFTVGSVEANLKGSNEKKQTTVNTFCGDISLKQLNKLTEKGIKLTKDGKQVTNKQLQSGVCCVKK